MKALLLLLAGSFLGGSAMQPLAAQERSLASNPAVKDLGQPANATKPAVPAPVGALPELELVRQFDQNGDHVLDANERQAARAFLAQHPPPEAPPAPTRPGQPVPVPVALEPLKPGVKFAAGSAALFPEQTAYDPKVVRTLFLEFEDAGWEAELGDFARTDVAVPARLTVDGRTYAGVGVHLRALPATATPPAGYKRPLDLALDATVAGQQFAGQRRLRLVPASSDPTFLRAMLYYEVARDFLPAPKACFVRLVINGENWGIYTSIQPLDENFARENYHTAAGARWSVVAGGNLAYLGDNPDAYRAAYRLQTPEDPAAWHRLAEFCKVLAQAGPGQLDTALEPYLDLENALRFFALENALINQDGYGSAAGGFGLYLDPAGRFHLVPQDAEASFRLVQVNEYAKGARRGGGRERVPDPAGKSAGEDPAEAKALKAVKERKNFPHQSGTNLAMLLSYSFVNKADSDFDGRVSREEWTAFARAWFLAMDEDRTGRLTRDQFIAKVRLLVTPTSITDGRTRQTFGKEDPAALIGGDLFAAIDEDHDGQVTPQEFSDTFDHWFTQWSDPKSRSLTQESLQTAFSSLFSRSVFQADQSYIATRDGPKPEAEEREHGNGGGGGRRGRGGGEGGGGAGLNLGPIHVGGFGGRGGGDGRTLVTFSEELDPLAGLDDEAKPLLSRLLSMPSLRNRYLFHVNEIAESWLTWSRLGAIAKEYHALIATDVLNDTHKSTSYEKFVQELDQDTTAGGREGDDAPSLKNFIEERSSYLRNDDMVGRRDR